MAAATQAADAEGRERMGYERDSIQWHLGMAATTALGAPEEPGLAELGERVVNRPATRPVVQSTPQGEKPTEHPEADAELSQQQPPAAAKEEAEAAPADAPETTKAPPPVPPVAMGGWGGSEPLQREAAAEETAEIEIEEIDMSGFETIESPRP